MITAMSTTIDSSEATRIEAQVRAWLDEVIVGMNLCPFAAPVLRAGRLRLRVDGEDDPEALVAALCAEAERLLDADPAALSTTIVVAPRAPADFEEFHGLTGLFEEWLEDNELDDELQVVSFHPLFRFADSRPGDLTVYVNRSPAPLWHLLRQSEIASAAADGVPTARVIARNSELLREMGAEGIRKVFGKYLPEEALPSEDDHTS